MPVHSPGGKRRMVARRLARSPRELAADFPLSPATVRALPPEVEDDLDAFLKRYERLVNATQDELFKVVAIVGGEDIRGLARREVAELMGRPGALRSVASFRVLVAIRNRIAVRGYLEHRLPAV